MKMQSSGGAESQHNASSDNVWAEWGSLFECRCLQFFWPRQLVRKWLLLKPTGDDFRADFHHFELDSPDGQDEDDESEGRENSCESTELLPALINPEQAQMTKFTSRLIRGQSETPGNQNGDSKEYRIAIGTWNIAGRPPPVKLNLDEWLDSNQEADVYVLGFQEIVPLNAVNVLCSEDEGPAEKWESLIREALNSGSTCSVQFKSQSAPQSPWRDLSGTEVQEIDMNRTIDGEVSEDTTYSPAESEFSALPKRASSKHLQAEYSKPTSRKPNRLTPEGSPSAANRTSIDVRAISDGGGISADPQTGSTEGRSHRSAADEFSPVKDESFFDWSLIGATSGPADGFQSFLEQEESMQTRLITPIPDSSSTESQSFSRDPKQSVKSRFSRIASKQMVGLFLTVWVRSGLRRHVHDVKVSCVGCGLMGYLGNKGSISVSMSLHQTSFCFVCSHLTSGDREEDKHHRNADVAEILRRTSFTRSSQLLQLPETILSHDCTIWLGDLNYRLDLPDQEARSLVAHENWDALLETDELKIEQNAERTFCGWQEGPIDFAPTYKYTLNSDQYSGKRTPAWCDRILYLGRPLRKIRYIRTESGLSDHRPVSALFIAEVEGCNISLKQMVRATSISGA